MPPYCLVCNQDLAQDTGGSATLCAIHAREQADIAANDAELARLRQQAPALPTCAVRVAVQVNHNQPPPPLPHPRQHEYKGWRMGDRRPPKRYPGSSITITADKTNHGLNLVHERFLVQHLEVVVSEHDGGDLANTWNVDQPDLVRAAVYRMHQQLVGSGWRPAYLPASSQFPIPGPGNGGLGVNTSNRTISGWERPFAYKLLPGVDEYALWEATTGKRLSNRQR